MFGDLGVVQDPGRSELWRYHVGASFPSPCAMHPRDVVTEEKSPRYRTLLS
jgi:hypothetical protein